MPQNRSLEKNDCIWIIDDEIDLARGYADFLEPEYKTRVFSSAIEALAAFDANETRPDAIVSDINMPELDGVSFLERLRTRDTNPPVILVSGYSDKNDLIRASSQNISGYFEKPFNPEQLVEVIRKTINEKVILKTQRIIIEIQDEIIKKYQELNSHYFERLARAENKFSEISEKDLSNSEKTQYLRDLYFSSQIHREIESLTKRIPRIN